MRRRLLTEMRFKFVYFIRLMWESPPQHTYNIYVDNLDILLLESPCSLVRHRKISHHRYMHHTYMQASGSRSRIIDMCIIYTCIRVKVQDHRYVHHTHMHQSQGSWNIDKCIIHGCIRIMDKCIIGMCIMVTCIRAKNICIAHAFKHQGQESYIHACFRIKVQDHRYASYTHASESRTKDHRYVHHTHRHQSQGLRNIDKCIIYTCIRVKDQGTFINASYVHVHWLPKNIAS